LLRPVSFYYALRPDIRRRCRPYLERRFGPAGFFTTLARTARLYANFADALFDRLLTGLGGRLTVEQCGVGRERMRALLDEGRGALVVSAHFGSWQSALIGMEEFGRPIAILQWVMEENPDSRYLSSNGSGHAFTVINAREGMTSTIRAAAFLRAGGIVCIMGDRMTPNDRHFVTARFLGGSVRLPAAPYLLASLSGAPVVHAFSVREGGRVRVLEPEIVRVP
ncbi:MAG: lysophospholipid acyltransferase family protein, partial [Desulfovibrionaceae bacterium]|nr:lysophospholipid acyltransferase family protein [Desulfovibrionaceae bacterium]